MATKDRTHCPTCAAPTSSKTLEKYNGVCRRCHKQPFDLRKQWIVFGLFAVASPLAAWFMDQELAAFEASGGEKRVNVLIALCYQFGGRIGVVIFFIGAGIASAALAYKSFRSALLAKDRNSSQQP